QLVAASQGVHIVLDKSFLPGESAIMVPHTRDGRVMFAIPWYHVAVVGTTDTPIDEVCLEPRPQDEEIDFILETANDYLSHPATREDILSVFAGIRPLVRADEAGSTAALSREHTIVIDPDSGLLTIVGGKWTTYRRMAEDVVDQASALAGLESRECPTKHLPIHGFHANPERFGRMGVYGSDAPSIEAGEPLHPRLALTEPEVVWFCRNEMARTVDDVLARRSRCLLFDAVAARELAGPVARIMTRELGHEVDARAFEKLAEAYLP
ncbi:MAG: glycerol-3-phosphate dehydrogenase/oxidase, partial [Planctomycetota bacterium]